MIGRRTALTAALFSPLALSACGPDYSPDTYSSGAVQHASKVDRAVVIGVRAVAISADATVATAAGGAAGGIAGSQTGPGAISALGAVGGSVAGGLVGNAIGHAAGDTDGFEYIVRKTNGDLMSVTQKDPIPLPLGEHVLIIEGPQARIVPDYTVHIADTAHNTDEQAKSSPAKPADAQAAATTSTKIETKPADAPTAVTATPLPSPTAATAPPVVPAPHAPSTTTPGSTAASTPAETPKPPPAQPAQPGAPS